MALQIVWCKDFRKIIFESDCQTVVNSLKGDHEEDSILNISQDIKVWRRKFEEIRFTYVLKNNRAAIYLHEMDHRIVFFSLIVFIFLFG